MNKTVTALVAFAVGAAISFFVTKKLLEEKYAQIAQEEIDSVKEIFGRTHTLHTETIDADGRPFATVSEYQENGMTDEQYEAKRSNPNGVMARSSLNIQSKSEVAKQNYHLISQQDEPEDDEDEEDEAGDYPVPDNGSERDLEGVDRTLPYLIDDREYSEEFDHHDKISLYYYVFDDVLCDENEAPMDDIDGTVGTECFKVLEHEPCVWVRNEPLGIDYEICVVRNSYAQAVHGINLNENLSPRERYVKERKRRDPSDE